MFQVYEFIKKEIHALELKFKRSKGLFLYCFLVILVPLFQRCLYS